MSLLSKCLPIYYLAWNKSYITIDKELNICNVTESIEDFRDMPIVVLSGELFTGFETVYDLNFFRFIIHSLKKDEQFSDEIKSIRKLESMEARQFGLSEGRSFLVEMLKIMNKPDVMTVFERYQSYYSSVARPIYKNASQFNKQKVRLAIKTLLRSKIAAKSDIIRYENNIAYVPIFVTPFNSETGRLNSNLYSYLKELKPFLRATNDAIIDVDTVAAEWKFLLAVCDETEKDAQVKDAYWDVLCKAIGIEYEGRLFKRHVLYPTIFGSSIKEIALKSGLDTEVVIEMRQKLWNHFPKVYRFLYSDNKYFSRDSSIVYDFYGKEMCVEDNYKKANYFLQSSLATHFQMFTRSLIDKCEEKGLRSKVLLTIHDSVLVDLAVDEKIQFFECIRQSNAAMKPSFRFAIKR